eukprot:TRINITY_DN3468_c0_g1_i2.p1 TRINITY_DN3468_c0_g1~~TRINITY_DN3468_c0_g1_i2.p1  ORF type:complete len:392 (-),score=99.11 TRINITY_DN3468_c0_g1_i2:118-1293(-)
MIRRPPRSTHCISSAASDVYKRQNLYSKQMGAEQQMGKLQKELEDVKIKNLDLEQQLEFEMSLNQKLKSDHQNKIQELTNSYEVNRKQTLESEINNLNTSHQSELNQYVDKVSFLNLKMQEMEQIQEKLTTEKIELNEQKKEAEQSNFNLQGEIAKLTGALEENKSLRQQFEFMSKKLDGLQKENGQLNFELEKQKKNVMQYESKYKDQQINLETEKKQIADKLAVLNQQLQSQNSFQIELNNERAKNSELQMQIGKLNQQLQASEQFRIKYEDAQTQLQSYQSESDNNRKNVEEKIAILRDLENWRNRALNAESRAEEVEIDIKGLILENERLNGVILNLHNDIEQLKITIKDLEKSDTLVRDLESKLKFYISENDKLNRILLNRSQQYY